MPNKPKIVPRVRQKQATMSITSSLNLAQSYLSKGSESDCFCCAEVATSFWGRWEGGEAQVIYSLCQKCSNGLWKLRSWNEQEGIILNRRIQHFQRFYRKRQEISDKLKEKEDGVPM